MLRANDALHEEAMVVPGRQYAKHHRIEFRVLRVDHTLVEWVSNGGNLSRRPPCFFVPARWAWGSSLIFGEPQRHRGTEARDAEATGPTPSSASLCLCGQSSPSSRWTWGPSIIFRSACHIPR